MNIKCVNNMSTSDHHLKYIKDQMELLGNCTKEKLLFLIQLAVIKATSYLKEAMGWFAVMFSDIEANEQFCVLWMPLSKADSMKLFATKYIRWKWFTAIQKASQNDVVTRAFVPVWCLFHAFSTVFSRSLFFQVLSLAELLYMKAI